MPRWLPETVSTHGADIVGFWGLLTWGVRLCFIIRYRRRLGSRSAYALGNTRPQVAWLLVPAFGVPVLGLGIDVPAATVWSKVKGVMPEGEVLVQVTASQFTLSWVAEEATVKISEKGGDMP